MGRRSVDSGVSEYKGRFHRTIGRAVNERGEAVPKKFLLGTDRRQAEAANSRLDRLWQEVVDEHEATARWLKDIGGRLADSDSISGHADPQHLRGIDHGPIWRAESLIIAEAVRTGEHQVLVQVGQDAHRPSAYLERLAYLRRTYSVVTFVPSSMALYLAGQQVLGDEAEALVQEAQQLCVEAQVPLPAATGQTLYQALDAYGAHALRKNSKESGKIEAACARRLKDAHGDIPLEHFGISAMESLAAYWASRPVSQKTGRPIALDTVANHLKTARRFVQWLHRTDAFKWTRPVDAEEALRVRVKRLRNDAEIAALSRGVAVWSVDDLTILYRYATDRERLLILLGLNCGFAQSEFCTLRHDEVIRDGAAAAVKRIRRKSHVYGEFPLWPETVKALEWLATLNNTAAAADDDRDYVMLTQEGHRYNRQRLANIWSRLLDRVQADYSTFRRLPFKHLRKTGGQLVRERSDGEVAGVFLCHGRPVASDELSDAYTNRPFGKVAKALMLVWQDLQPLFDAVPEVFTEKSRSSPNITRAMIEQIQKLRADGVRPAEIVRVTGLTLQTIRRWTSRIALTTTKTP